MNDVATRTAPVLPATKTISTSDLFERFQVSRERSLRNELVERHLSLAEFHARRFSRRRASYDDLRQVAVLGIVFAVERFDPSVGVSFGTFANRTVEGECKRYLRDRTWTVRPPRRSQELHLGLWKTEEELTQRLGRSPRLTELAAAAGCDEEAVLQALEARSAYESHSLETSESAAGAASIGRTDPGFQAVDHRAVVERALRELSPRERAIVELRFFAQLSQPEIAVRLGMSQSYLSRLLRRILADLRLVLDESARPTDAD